MSVTGSEAKDTRMDEKQHGLEETENTEKVADESSFLKNEDEQYENVLDDFIQKELGGDDNTNTTTVRVIDDSGRGEGVGKRTLPKDEEDLGIYEDTDVDDDDLSDTEQELQRLREEKQQREDEERKERERQEAEIRAAKIARLKAEEEKRLQKQREDEQEAERVLAEIAKQLPDERPTPREDAGASSRTSIRTWTDPRFLQGMSVKELYWKSLHMENPMTTSMATQMEQSM